MTRHTRQDPDAATMSLGEHLEELRRRLIFALAGVIPLLALSLTFGTWLLRILIEPLTDQLLRAGLPPTLQTLSPVEAFGAWLKVATVATVILGIPWILWQLWLFVRPGLYPEERRFARFLAPFSAIMSIVGALFLYFAVLPVMLYFLILFGSNLAPSPPPVAPLPPGVATPAIPVLDADPENPAPGAIWALRPAHQLRLHMGDGQVYSAPLSSGGLVVQHYRLKDYVDLVFLMALVFALTFQAPIAIMLVCWTGLVSPADLRSKRRHAALACVVLGAILTPTGDPATLALLAVPLYLLFELGLFLAAFVPARRVARGLLRPAPPAPREGDTDDES